MHPQEERCIDHRLGGPFSQGFALFVIGLGVGWLSGLSVSPVASTLISSLFGIIAGAFAGFKGAGSPAAGGKISVFCRLDARPAALLVLGIALAVPLGILTRSHHLLEPVQVRQQVLLGKKTPSAGYQGVLFNFSASECEELLSPERRQNETAFRNFMQSCSLPGAERLATEIRHFDDLQLMVSILCESGSD